MKFFFVTVKAKYPSLMAKIFTISCTSAGTAIARAIRLYRNEIGKKRLYSLIIKCDLAKRPQIKKSFSNKLKLNPIKTEDYKNEKIKMVSLGELSKERKLNLSKSMLHYYAQLGLIVPMGVVGEMQIYNEEEVIEKIKMIKRYKKQGITLKKIKEIFNPSSAFSPIININSNNQEKIFDEHELAVNPCAALDINKIIKKSNQDKTAFENLLNIKKAAEFIGVSPSTLRKWEKDGIISPKRIGLRNDRRYTKEQLLELLVNKH